MAKNGQRCGENGQNLTKFQMKCYWLKLVTTALWDCCKTFTIRPCDGGEGIHSHILSVFPYIFSLRPIQSSKIRLNIYEIIRKLTILQIDQHWFNFLESFPVGIYLLKVNNRNTWTRCEICSKLTIKTAEPCRLG